MTDIQVKFNALRETERANRAQEELKQQGLDLQAEKQKYEIEQLIANTELSQANKDKVAVEVNKLYEEINNLRARTDLTKAQIATEISKASQNFLNIIGDITGINFAKDIIKSIVGGASGPVAKALIG